MSAKVREDLIGLCQMLAGGPFVPISDWNLAIDWAHRNAALPLLYQALREHAEEMPPALWQALQADYYAAVAQSLLWERQLEQVLGTLDDAGVPVVLLKGAALARAVYPDPALRAMGDLDLWIPQDKMDRAREGLESEGYTMKSKQTRPLTLQDAYLGETQMRSQEAGHGLVELHWNVFPGEWLRQAARIDEDLVRARSVPLDGVSAKQLAPEDAVLNVCLHLAINHQMSGMGARPLLDLAYMWAAWEIDWSKVAQRARDWQVETAVWLVLDLFGSLFGYGKILEPLHSLRPSPPRRLVLRRFVSLDSFLAGQGLKPGPARRFFLLCLIDNSVDAGRLIWRTFFPERHWLSLLYGLEGAPMWRIRLQQLYHPFRVFVQGDL